MGSEIAITPTWGKAGGGRKAVQAAWLASVLGAGVAGCSSVPAALNPVEWWHGLQGGKIAEERPAPPGADDPYPNLGTVPARPAPSDPKLRQQIADALIADRGNAQHDAAGVQLVDPSNPNAAPGLFGRGSARPPAPPPPGGASASFPGADATTAPPSSPPAMATERATVGGVQSNALEQPEADRPALPSGPPAPANLPGAPASAPVPPDRPAAAIPSTTIAAQPATAADAAAAPPPASTPLAASETALSGTGALGRGVGVPFAVGSAVVPRPSISALRQLATRRGGGGIAITGFGEATGTDAAAQSAALSLALARAQAVAGALTSFGVPASAIRIDAEASGRGAAARLIE